MWLVSEMIAVSVWCVQFVLCISVRAWASRPDEDTRAKHAFDVPLAGLTSARCRQDSAGLMLKTTVQRTVYTVNSMTSFGISYNPHQ